MSGVEAAGLSQQRRTLRKGKSDEAIETESLEDMPVNS